MWPTMISPLTIYCQPKILELRLWCCCNIYYTHAHTHTHVYVVMCHVSRDNFLNCFLYMIHALFSVLFCFFFFSLLFPSCQFQILNCALSFSIFIDYPITYIRFNLFFHFLFFFKIVENCTLGAQMRTAVLVSGILHLQDFIFNLKLQTFVFNYYIVIISLEEY